MSLHHPAVGRVDRAQAGCVDVVTLSGVVTVLVSSQLIPTVRGVDISKSID